MIDCKTGRFKYNLRFPRPGVETSGYFRQSLWDAVFSKPKKIDQE
jgi:hypothetical protein